MEGTDLTTENLVNQFFTDATTVFNSGTGEEYASADQLTDFDKTKQQLQTAITTGDEVAQPILLIAGLQQAATILNKVPESKLDGFTQVDQTMKRLLANTADLNLKKAIYDFQNVYDSMRPPVEFNIQRRPSIAVSDTKSNVPLDDNVQDLLALARAHDNFSRLSTSKKKSASSIFDDFAHNAGDAAMRGTALSQKLSGGFNAFIKSKADVNSPDSLEKTTYNAMLSNIQDVVGLGSVDDVVRRMTKQDVHGDAFPTTVKYLKSMQPYFRDNRDLDNLLTAVEAHSYSRSGSKINPQPRPPKGKPVVEELKGSDTGSRLGTLRTDSQYVPDFIDLSSVKNVSDEMKPDTVMDMRESNISYEQKMLKVLGKKRNRKLKGAFAEIINDDDTRERFPDLVRTLETENENLDKLRVGKKFVGMLTNAADRSNKYKQKLVSVKNTIDKLAGDAANIAPELEGELEEKRAFFYKQQLELDQKEQYLDQVSKQIQELKGRRLVDVAQQEFKLNLLQGEAKDNFSKQVIAEVKNQLASASPNYFNVQDMIAKEQVSIKQLSQQATEDTTVIKTELGNLRRLRDRQHLVQGEFEDKRGQIDKFLGENGYAAQQSLATDTLQEAVNRYRFASDKMAFDSVPIEKGVKEMTSIAGEMKDSYKKVKRTQEELGRSAYSAMNNLLDRDNVSSILDTNQRNELITYMNQIRAVDFRITNDMQNLYLIFLRNSRNNASANTILSDQLKHDQDKLLSEMQTLLNTYERELQHRIGMKGDLEYAKDSMAKMGIVLPNISDASLIGNDMLVMIRKDIHTKDAALKTEGGLAKQTMSQLKSLMEETRHEAASLEESKLKQESLYAKIRGTFAKQTYDQKIANVESIASFQNIKDEIKKIQKVKDDNNQQLPQLKIALGQLNEDILKLELSQKELKQLNTKTETTQANNDVLQQEYALLQIARQALEKKTDSQKNIAKLLKEDRISEAVSALGLPNAINGTPMNMIKQLDDVVRDSRGLNPATSKLSIEQFSFLKKQLHNHDTFKNQVKYYLQELGSLSNVQGPSLQESARTLGGSLHTLVSKYIGKVSQYAFSPEQRDQRQDVLMQNEISDLQLLLKRQANLVDDFEQLDIEHYSVGQMSAHAKKSLTELLSGSLASKATPMMNKLASLTQQLNTASTNLNSFTEVNSIAGQISRTFKEITQLVKAIRDDDLHGQTTTKINEHSQQIVDELIRQNPQVNVIRSKLGMVDLNKAISDVFFRSAHTLMKRSNGDYSNEDMRDRDGGAANLAKLLYENKLIGEDDIAQVEQNALRFVMQFDSEVKDEVLDRLARIASEQHKDIFDKVRTTHVKEYLKNKTFAQSFIADHLDPRLDPLHPDEAAFRDQLHVLTQNAVDKIPEIGREYEAMLQDPAAYAQPELKRAQIKEEVKKTLAANKATRFGIESKLHFQGNLLNPLRPGKSSLPDELAGITLASYQRNLNAVPKAELPAMNRDLVTQKMKLERIYGDYDIRPDDVSDQNEVRAATSDLIMFLKRYLPAQQDKPNINSYLGSSFSTQDELLASTPWSRFGFAADVLAHQKKIIETVVAPIESKMADADRPTRQQLITLNALKKVFTVAGTIFGESMHDEDFLADNTRHQMARYQMIDDVRNGAEQISYIPNSINRRMEPVRQVELINNFLNTKIITATETARANLDNNIQVLDSMRDLVKQREQGEAPVDKFDKINDDLDRYGQKFSSQLEGMLFKNGLKSFFDKDSESQQYVKRAQQSMFPRFQQQQQQQQQQERKEGEPEQKKTFVASKGSEAAESGNSNMNRLSSEAIAKIRADNKANLSGETITFMSQIYFDKSHRKLMIKTEGEPRELTKEEKKRFIKVMVSILLVFYIKQVKKLSNSRKNEAQSKMIKKYAKHDPQPLFKMINKLASEHYEKPKEE